MQRQNFEKLIRNAIVRHSATTRPERERIYTAARSSFRRRPLHTQDDLAELDAAIAAIEATFATETRRPHPSQKSGWLRAATIALFLGVALGAGASAYIQADASTPDAEQDAKALDYFQQAYRSNLPHMPAATEFIRQVVDAVVERQKKDESSLQESTKTFISLTKFDPELAKQMPKTLPKGTAVILKANATDLKVLMNWTLCGVASITNPEMIDKKRAPKPSLGCPYFGLWTNTAADW